MNVSLSPVLEEYVRRKIAAGSYSDASEVVCEALRLMRERETGGRPVPRKDEVVAALKALEPELRQRGIASVALFGSLVRGEAQPDSDIDMLAEIDPAADFDLLDLVGVQNFIGDRLNYKVEIVEKASLKPLVRDDIVAEAERVF